MKKFLYFASGAPDATTSTEEVACFPVETLSHFEMHTATALRVYFNAGQEGSKLTGNLDDGTGAAGSIDNPVIVLTITSGKHKEAIEAICGAIASPAAINTPMIVVADSENGVFIDSSITACASLAVVDAS